VVAPAMAGSVPAGVRDSAWNAVAASTGPLAHAAMHAMLAHAAVVGASSGQAWPPMTLFDLSRVPVVGALPPKVPAPRWGKRTLMSAALEAGHWPEFADSGGLPDSTAQCIGETLIAGSKRPPKAPVSDSEAVANDKPEILATFGNVERVCRASTIAEYPPRKLQAVVVQPELMALAAAAAAAAANHIAGVGHSRVQRR